MTSFAEWLLQKSKNCEKFSVPEEGEIGDMVSVRALGEWAINKAKIWLNAIYAETPKRYRKDFEAFQELRKDFNQFSEPSETFICDIYWEIAVACLGEAEVRKRLEAVKK